MSNTIWVVALDFTGTGEHPTDVLQTADSRSEACAACNIYTKANPEHYAEPMTWDEAYELGLVK